MGWLRLFAVLGLMAASCAGGAAASSARYELELSRLHREGERLRAEISGYKKLANATMAMSDKSLDFAQKYQSVLDNCLRFYNTPMPEPMVVVGRGGIGGPVNAGRGSRLP